MAEKRISSTFNSLLDDSSKRLRTNLSSSSNLLSNLSGGSGLKLGSTSSKLSLTSSLLSKPSSLSSGLSLTSKLDVGTPKTNIESGFLQLSLQTHSGVESKNKNEKQRSSQRKIVEKRKLEHVKKASTPKRGVVPKVDKTSKKKKIERASGEITSENVGQYSMSSAPEYQIKCQNEEYIEIGRLPDFVSPDKDPGLMSFNKIFETDLIGLKRSLINLVSGSLVSQPKFTDKNDPMRLALMESVDAIRDHDPEFTLKVALYARKELNIRTTSNFLLALASNISRCKPYLKKYFNASIALPSDWMEVAEIFQTLEDHDLQPGALSTALRKVMITKFGDFDEYQLAKYNKESSGKKKVKKPKPVKGPTNKKATPRLYDSDSSDSDEEEDKLAKANRQLSGVSYDEQVTETELKHQKFTIKQLIRKLHITRPVEHIMSIIGKKYPDTSEEFIRSKLPGIFDDEKAGKRMKLAIPETWETQVSLKGNKAKTWEDLIDHKKLPFMAMLRNLRNLIKAGISEKHHSMIIRRLCDRRQVVNSKQFPFRFFSAYAVLQQLEKDLEQNQEDIQNAIKGIAKPQRDKGGATSDKPWWVVKKLQKKKEETLTEVPYKKKLLDRYRTALDTSVKLATTYNVQPIKGRTIIMCDFSSSMDTACSSARGLGKPRTIKEVSTLMGLMCQHACEDCTFILFTDRTYKIINHEDDLILKRLETILEEDINNNGHSHGSIPFDFLLESFRDQIQIDNLLVFSQDLQPSSHNGRVLNDFLSNYRKAVNPNLLFVSMAFNAAQPGFDNKIDPRHPNDIYISGYSDAILRFIAERGDSGLIQHVDKIDDAYQLRPLPDSCMQSLGLMEHRASEAGPQLTIPKCPSWRTLRVFISSTFRDMHAERDLLTRFIFPQLRDIASKHFINVYEVDLRWGITEDEVKTDCALAACLEEVRRCDLFIGLLGERYGWTPETYRVPDTCDFDWVRDYPAGASITELEMYAGALSKVDDVQEKAFFFLRDNSFEKDVPSIFKEDFKSENETSRMKMKKLKDTIRTSGLQVFDNYPCSWAGYVDGKPMVAGLDAFGGFMLNTLVNAVEKLCPDEDASLTEETRLNQQHWAFVEKYHQDYDTSSSIHRKIGSIIYKTSSGVVGILGTAGSGKTSTMAAVIKSYLPDLMDFTMFVNMAGAAPGSTSLTATIRRLAELVNSRFSLNHTLPEDFTNLVIKFEELLTEASEKSIFKLVVFMDGVDGMQDNHPTSLEWLPSKIPNNVVFVFTALEKGDLAKSLKRIGATEFTLQPFSFVNRADFVRSTLGKHRKALKESGFGNEMKLMMVKKDAHNPLYLKLACEELRVFGVFEKITDKLKSLPHTTPQLLQAVLARLEEEHGKDVISVALSLIACTRDGVYKEELHDLIGWYYIYTALNGMLEAKDISIMHQYPDQNMSNLSFTYLARSIMSFVNPSHMWSPVLSFANAEIETAVRIRYLKGKSSFEESLHRVLAGFFWRGVDRRMTSEEDNQDSRNFAQFPYHLACAGDFKHLEIVLCDHKFIQTKCAVGLATDLLNDFELNESCAKSRDAAKFLASEKVQQYKSFISRNINILSKYPSLELQQALDEPMTSAPYIDAVALKETSGTNQDLMVCLTKPEKENQCYRTMTTTATCMKVSPNGCFFATGSQDTVVRLYDKDTAKELSSFMGHSDAITDVCFVGNKHLCSASADTTLSLWDIDRGHRIHILKSHNRRVAACASDHEGKVIASGSWDGTVILWNVSDGSRLHVFEIGSPVNSVDFHPAFDLLCAGSWDSKICIFNTLYHKRVAVLRSHSRSVRDVVFSNDGTHLASADMDGNVKIWDSKKGVVVGSVKGHSEPITKMLFSPSGKELITASNDNLIKLWSSNVGIPTHCLSTDKLGKATSVILSPDGERVVIGYHSGMIRMHDVDSGNQLLELKAGSSAITALCFFTTEKKQQYLLAAIDKTVQVWDIVKKKCVTTLVGATKPILCVASIDDMIATGGEDCTVQTYPYFMDVNYDIISERFLPEITSANNTDASLSTSAVTSLSFSKGDGDKVWMIGSNRDAEVCIATHNASKWEKFSNLHSDWINSSSMDPHTNMVATGSNDFNIKLWDWNEQDLKENCILSGHEASVNTVQFEHGYVVSGSSDNTLKVWSHKGVEVTTLRGHTERVNGCALFTGTNDDDCNIKEAVVASAGDDGNVWLWKPFLAHQLATLSGHSDRVLSISADKEGHVTSCSLDGTVKVWKPQTNQKTSDSVHDAPVTFIAKGRNNRVAISGSRDGIVKIWQSKSSTDVLELKSSFQAHKKTVTCGCFTWESSDKFMTGGNDSQVITWQIVDEKKKFSVRKLNSMTTIGPVTAVHCGSKPEQLVYTTLFGDVMVCHPSGRKSNVLALNEVQMPALKSWVTSIGFHEDTPCKLKCATNDNSVYFVNINREYNSADVGDKHIVDKTILDVEKNPNWVCCVTEAMGKVIAGDSKGQISIGGTVLKIHESDITAVDVYGETLFTASRDMTIKVWTLCNTAGQPPLTQVGQFFCPAPLTSLKVVFHIQERDNLLFDVYLMAGDQLGNIHQLKWQKRQ